jgi:hypothetical protein
MGLYEKYKFPDMYTSPELGDATNKLVAAARRAADHDLLALPDIEVEIPEDVKLAEPFVHATQDDHRPVLGTIVGHRQSRQRWCPVPSRRSSRML